MPNTALQDAIHDWMSDEGQTDATMLAGQLEVIAEELKTANLIAFMSHSAKMGSFDVADSLAKTIVERLDLP